VWLAEPYASLAIKALPMNGRNPQAATKVGHKSPDRCVPLHEPAPPQKEVKKTNYVGIDIGKKRCAACVTDEKGNILRELEYHNTRSSIESLAETLAEHGECRAVLESTGNLWLKSHEILEAHGVPVKLANPLKTRAIAEACIKTDRLTARILAHLLRADLIPECQHPAPRGEGEEKPPPPQGVAGQSQDEDPEPGAQPPRQARPQLRVW